ncbi:MAG: hypothetical protein HOH79_07650 [Euryarchaeota archaeon]|jgi:tRNA G37 N-methylase Trm5|nr:hypothetical protein [Euryarchaeota archaeon]MBT6640298.1 hypothetical protein [Euryarchaeota archaeon]MBT7063751.1 hypothetical protein [Euryarchaeota archaeon]MBT7263140.1 hypothetical protein [Euryarchaeota archaeon]MBT7637939.1 hypothetical protein [Euryarchaeota archaeon]
MLKPQTRLDGASVMRHLSVPSAQTQHWLDLCRTQKWSSNEAGVTRLDNGRNAIPINDSAPGEEDEVWGNNPHIEIEVQQKGPTHWLDHIDEELAETYREDWPRSYEIQGDILIVKIEETVWIYGEMIADAMLTQLPNIRLVCADLGVKGEFRVRELHPLASRDGTLETRTRIRENGYLLWVDPTAVYFSSRLSNERVETLATAKQLRNQLKRPLVVCDPYAGVGPSLGALLSEPDLVSGYYVGDLNPDATELLALNIEYLDSRRKNAQGGQVAPLYPAELHCRDALEWAKDSGNHNQIDLLLVNLPHQSISHIEALLPLLKRNQTSVLRGWAIIERLESDENEEAIRCAISSANGNLEKFTFKEVKGFSTTKSFMCFEAWLNLSV